MFILRCCLCCCVIASDGSGGDGDDDDDCDMEQQARAPQQLQHTVFAHDAVDVFLLKVLFVDVLDADNVCGAGCCGCGRSFYVVAAAGDDDDDADGDYEKTDDAGDGGDMACCGAW